MPTADFDLDQFLPYLLNQAAEATSAAFQAAYRGDYGMTRTQWRVLAHLGKRRAMTAAEICRMTYTDKTKVSRAVQALEVVGWLRRDGVAGDRRREMLSLTPKGLGVFEALGKRALEYDRQLRALLGTAGTAHLADALSRLIVAAPVRQNQPADDGQ